MELKTETLEKGKVLLNCSGRIDTLTSVQFESSLMRAIQGADTAYLSMESVDFISSAGLRVLLQAARSMTGRNSRFVIYKPADHVMKILAMAGFDKIFEIKDTLDESSSS